MGLFGQSKSADPKELVREWQRKLRQEQRSLDRQIAGITREEWKVKKQVKESAKKGDMDVCRILAKEIVNARKTVAKLHTSKAQINSVAMNMQHQAASIRMAGAIQSSTDVMKSMQSLVKVPEIAATMREMSQEMMKAGIIEEMMEDTMESIEPEDMEEEIQNEVDKVLFEVTEGKLGFAPSVPAGSVSVRPEVEGEREEAIASPPQEDMAEMQQRLEELRS